MSGNVLKGKKDIKNNGDRLIMIRSLKNKIFEKV